MAHKLLYLVNQRMPSEKAYGLQISKMCEAFGRNQTVELIIPTRGSNRPDIFSAYCLEKDFTVTVLASPNFYWPGVLDRFAVTLKSFISAFRLQWYVRNQSADIIYSRDELPLYLLSFGQPQNLVFEAHRFSPQRVFFYRRFLKKGYKLVVISEGLRQRFLEFGFPPERVLTAHDGIDLEEFTVHETKEVLRKELNLPLGKKIIGYVGQLTTFGREKGVASLLEAFKAIHKQHPESLLLIVGGSGPDIQHYQEASGTNEAILFAGYKPHTSVPRYLAACDVLAMPYPDTEHYRVFMSPLKLFEYMASGRPIIATDLQSIREVLNEKNAVLVAPDTVDALSEGLLHLLEDKTWGEQKALQALQDIKHHTWELRARKIIDFITL
ncbi:MAG: glycosyltransferase family 4 protein [Candidatus Yanofskybacteria bacterium]|nr:glycosyltransferase family 4 protein [Candidatus Yanofskybacteria bacterium]